VRGLFQNLPPPPACGLLVAIAKYPGIFPRFKQYTARAAAPGAEKGGRGASNRGARGGGGQELPLAAGGRRGENRAPWRRGRRALDLEPRALARANGGAMHFLVACLFFSC